MARLPRRKKTVPTLVRLNRKRMELAIKTTENGDIDGDGGRLKAVADNEFIVAAKRDFEVGVAGLSSGHWAVSGMSLDRFLLMEKIST